MDAPWAKLTAKQQKVILHGAKGNITVKYKNRYGRQRQYTTTYEGVIPWIKRRHEGAESDWAASSTRATCARCRARCAAAPG